MLYIDDILIIGNNIGMLSAVNSLLSRYFSIKDLRDVSNILGIQIYRNIFKMILTHPSPGIQTPLSKGLT